MNVLDLVAASLLWLYLPIPVYWLLLHPLKGWWRGHARAALITAALAAWIPGAAFIWSWREELFAAAEAPGWAVVAGLVLVALDAAMLVRVHGELGSDRLMGRTELSGGGELATGGLYAHMRHPRYAAMMAGMLGVCLMAGSLRLWAVAGAWWLLVLVSVWFEERELVSRFGEAYTRYRGRVPAFLPFRWWPQKD